MRNHSKDMLTPKVIPPELARELSKEVAKQGMFEVDDNVLSKQPIQAVAERFQSNHQTGMQTTKAEERLAKDGFNELYQEPPPSVWKLFFEQLKGFVILLLIAAAFASLAMAAVGTKREDPLQYITGFFILLLVVVNAGIAAKTEAQAKRSGCFGCYECRNSHRCSRGQGIEGRIEVPGERRRCHAWRG